MYKTYKAAAPKVEDFPLDAMGDFSESGGREVPQLVWIRFRTT
jgi:hypothetical protein